MVQVIETAHNVGLNTTATIMFGHVDGPKNWARHLIAIRDLQQRTGGITEFVPLPFVHMEAPIYLKGGALPWLPMLWQPPCLDHLALFDLSAAASKPLASYWAIFHLSGPRGKMCRPAGYLIPLAGHDRTQAGVDPCVWHEHIQPAWKNAVVLAQANLGERHHAAVQGAPEKARRCTSAS